MARGNIEVWQIMWDIRSARRGAPRAMPDVYRRLAVALRSSELTEEEREFVALRLEAVAAAAPGSGDASTNARHARAVCKALLLSRGRTKKTPHEAETDKLTRALAMLEKVKTGMSKKDAAEALAGVDEKGGDTRPFTEAFDEYVNAFNEIELEGGPDPRLTRG